VLAKTEARKIAESKIRTALKSYVTYNPAVTDEDRRNMELPVHDKKPTPVPPPATMSAGEVDFSIHQQHRVHVKERRVIS
jgi:hypothetical protein